MPWLGLAAALVLITIGVYVDHVAVVARVAGDDRDRRSNPPRSIPSKRLSRNFRRPRRTTRTRCSSSIGWRRRTNGAIEPSLAKLLRDQLEMADRAIAESRQAMQSDPTSQPARESLFEAFRRKVSVLQATVSLMNEMRQGNPDGASRAAAGLNNKKG